MARTTINIDADVRKSLASKRKYKRETYDEILKRLLEKDKRRLKK